jgi:hypothetical protein
MYNWLLVIASMRDKAPTEAELRNQFSTNALSAASSRVIVLNRHALIHMFGPSFVERSRLWVDKHLAVDKASAAPQQRSAVTSQSQVTGAAGRAL